MAYVICMNTRCKEQKWRRLKRIGEADIPLVLQVLVSDPELSKQYDLFFAHHMRKTVVRISDCFTDRSVRLTKHQAETDVYAISAPFT